jgi:hypothetical protein
MNKDPDTTKPGQPEPTPEVDKLLKILEIQSAATRFRPSPLHSNSFRYGTLVAIVVIAFGSLGILEWVLSQMPKPAHPAASGNTPVATPSASILSNKYHN